MDAGAEGSSLTMVNIMAIIRAATMGDPKRVRPMVLWTMLEYFMRGAPYGIVLAVTWVLFDALTNPGAPINIAALVGLCVSLLVSLALLHLVSKRAYLEMFDEAYGLCAEGRLAMGDHLRKLSMGFFNARDPGAIGSYLITDYANVEFIFTHLVPQAVGALTMPLLLLLVLATQNWRMALAAALVIPVSIPFTFITRAFIHFFGKQHQKTKIETASRMLEYVQGMRLIKAFNLTGTKFERLEKVFRRFKSLSIKLEGGSGPTVLLSGFVLHSGQTLIILLGLTWLFAGTLPLPVYIMFLILGVRVYEPLIQLFVFLAELNYYKISVDRIEDLRTTPALSGTQPQLQPANYKVAFENVSFHYLDTDVLRNINVAIPEHSFVALVGPSGSGKTTMTRLIARFWDVTAGRITLGGHDRAITTPPPYWPLSPWSSRMSTCSTTRCSTTSASARPRRPRKRSSLPQKRLAATTLSASCQTATKPWLARAARPSRAAKSSASLSPAPCSRALPLCCWTRPPPRSTRRTNCTSKRQSTAWCEKRPSSSSRTGSTPSSTPTQPWYWKTGKSSSKARTMS